MPTPHALLHESLDRRFPDGSRRAVLVVGAGLQHHLRGHGETYDAPVWKAFCDWNGLLASVASDFELPIVEHVDPTATWESLVTRLAAKLERRAADAETQALKVLARRLDQLPAGPAVLARFGAALRAGGWRDVVSLNFDRTLDRALWDATAVPRFTAEPKHLRRPTIHTAAHGDGLPLRTWYPHGHVHAYETIQLGQRAYGMGIAALEGARERLKGAERAWRTANGVPRAMQPADHDAWEDARRATTPYGASGDGEAARPSHLTWLDLFLLSDLVFVGCGLDRGEVDLWWALHQRARNFARVPTEHRPRTFVLGTERTFLEHRHLATGVADVIPVPLPSWDHAWEGVVGRWWE